mmetsp:Transcript_134676/g.430194  ORF Transcript_134676/g.430194 Transcript_134676/m.430194 type:complete len:382 (-) Transcript_134676:815-1960(-)
MNIKFLHQPTCKGKIMRGNESAYCTPTGTSIHWGASVAGLEHPTSGEHRLDKQDRSLLSQALRFTCFSFSVIIHRLVPNDLLWRTRYPSLSFRRLRLHIHPVVVTSERHRHQWVLLAHEATARRWRHLHHRVPRDRRLPRLLDGGAAEVGNQELEHGDVAHDEHRPRGHLDLNEDGLQPLDEVHIALAARKPLLEGVALPTRIELRVPLLHFLPGRSIPMALHIPPSSTHSAFVDGIQGRRLLIVDSGVGHRGDRTGQGAGQHTGRLLFLACCAPISLRPRMDELGQRKCKAPASIAELRQPIALARGLRIGISCAGPHEPNRSSPNVDGHHEGQDAVGQSSVAVTRHDLAGKIEDLDVGPFGVLNGLVHVLILADPSLEV